MSQFLTRRPKPRLLKLRKLLEMGVGVGVGVTKATRAAWNFIFDKLLYVPLHITYYVKIPTYFAVRWCTRFRVVYSLSPTVSESEQSDTTIMLCCTVM
jgi:hypothetical protein